MKQIMYVFERGRLVGMQDVTDWPVRSIDKAITALAMVNRTADVSSKGRGVCAYCETELGERELPAGHISHGICPACFSVQMDAVNKIEVKHLPGWAKGE